LGIGSRLTGTPESDPAGVVRVLFTNPSTHSTGTNTGGLDVELVALIDESRKSVDVASFGFDLANVADALVRAEQRGVRVRLVTDSDYAEELGPATLRAAGVPVVPDDRDAFMHNKFVVIDGDEIWTGSWNLTEDGTYRHNNNVVVIQSTKMAENFTAEFEEMFEDGAFGATSPDSVPYPYLDLNGIQIETIFESEGNARERIIDLIEDADNSVLFMSFVLTDNDISKAFVVQHRAGVRVAGVVESRNTEDEGSDFEALRQAGVDVLADGNPYLLHHKVIILDGSIVITGSYNFSASAADNNDENVLIIRSPEVAVRYVEEFNSVYGAADEEAAGN
ncbi:MAG: phospholipase D-like domain-containing protein, partial [Anaerolineae bacterium]|nr:phospholipase D-like domain-containing protein [Anaerolineae bacterium]